MAFLNNNDLFLKKQLILNTNKPVNTGINNNAAAANLQQTSSAANNTSVINLPNLVSSYSNGTSSVEQLQNGIANAGAQVIVNNGLFSANLDGKVYNIKTNTSSPSTQVFTRNELMNTYKFSSAIIDKYFETTSTKNFISLQNGPAYFVSGYKTSGLSTNNKNSSGSLAVNLNNTKYKLKSDCGFRSIRELQEHVNQFDQYQDDLILDNFLQGKTSSSDASSVLSQNKNGFNITAANYDEYISEIGLATGDKAKELRKQALDKLIQDFSSGNLTYSQAQTVLQAIGVENLQLNYSNEKNFTFNFSYDRKKYSITCNREAAQKSTDSITVKTYTQEEFYALPSSVRPMLTASVSIDGRTTTYVLSDKYTAKDFESAMVEASGFDTRLDNFIAKDGGAIREKLLAIIGNSDFAAEQRVSLTQTDCEKILTAIEELSSAYKIDNDIKNRIEQYKLAVEMFMQYGNSDPEIYNSCANYIICDFKDIDNLIFKGTAKKQQYIEQHENDYTIFNALYDSNNIDLLADVCFAPSKENINFLKILAVKSSELGLTDNQINIINEALTNDPASWSSEFRQEYEHYIVNSIIAIQCGNVEDKYALSSLYNIEINNDQIKLPDSIKDDEFMLSIIENLIKPGLADSKLKLIDNLNIEIDLLEIMSKKTGMSMDDLLRTGMFATVYGAALEADDPAEFIKQFGEFIASTDYKSENFDLKAEVEKYLDKNPNVDSGFAVLNSTLDLLDETVVSMSKISLILKDTAFLKSFEHKITSALKNADDMLVTTFEEAALKIIDENLNSTIKSILNGEELSDDEKSLLINALLSSYTTSIVGLYGINLENPENNKYTISTSVSLDNTLVEKYEQTVQAKKGGKDYDYQQAYIDKVKSKIAELEKENEGVTISYELGVASGHISFSVSNSDEEEAQALYLKIASELNSLLGKKDKANFKNTVSVYDYTTPYDELDNATWAEVASRYESTYLKNKSLVMKSSLKRQAPDNEDTSGDFVQTSASFVQTANNYASYFQAASKAFCVTGTLASKHTNTKVGQMYSKFSIYLSKINDSKAFKNTTKVFGGVAMIATLVDTTQDGTQKFANVVSTSLYFVPGLNLGLALWDTGALIANKLGAPDLSSSALIEMGTKALIEMAPKYEYVNDEKQYLVTLSSDEYNILKKYSSSSEIIKNMCNEYERTGWIDVNKLYSIPGELGKSILTEMEQCSETYTNKNIYLIKTSDGEYVWFDKENNKYYNSIDDYVSMNLTTDEYFKVIPGNTEDETLMSIFKDQVNTYKNQDGTISNNIILEEITVTGTKKEVSNKSYALEYFLKNTGIDDIDSELYQNYIQNVLYSNMSKAEALVQANIDTYGVSISDSVEIPSAPAGSGIPDNSNIPPIKISYGDVTISLSLTEYANLYTEAAELLKLCPDKYIGKTIDDVVNELAAFSEEGEKQINQYYVDLGKDALKKAGYTESEINSMMNYIKSGAERKEILSTCNIISNITQMFGVKICYRDVGTDYVGDINEAGWQFGELDGLVYDKKLRFLEEMIEGGCDAGEADYMLFMFERAMSQGSIDLSSINAAVDSMNMIYDDFQAKMEQRQEQHEFNQSTIPTTFIDWDTENAKIKYQQTVNNYISEINQEKRRLYNRYINEIISDIINNIDTSSMSYAQLTNLQTELAGSSAVSKLCWTKVEEEMRKKMAGRSDAYIQAFYEVWG